MNLLVTGGCGFIGSHFINYYATHYPLATLVNMDAMYYCASEDNVDTLKDVNYVFVKGNINSSDLVNHILTSYAITHVIHFAARSHVDGSFEEALAYSSDNVLGTHVLLECCRKYNSVKKFIHVSTDEVYGESLHDELPKTELTSVLCPTNPYAATKAAAELIAQSYYRSFGIPIVITRCNNVYGPRQYPEKLIPKFIKLLKEEHTCTIHGDGTQTRSFLHVSDVVKAFALILNTGCIGEIYNIATTEEYTVNDIAERLIGLIHPNDACSDWITYVQDRPFNDRRYNISNTKLLNMGWLPCVAFKEGLEELV
jgi:dTDP-glucose 4,6-dehydratase